MTSVIQRFAHQFRGLSSRDIASWPAAPKASLLLAIVIATTSAGYFADIEAQIQDLEAQKAREVELKAEYVQKYARAINLDLYKAQLKEVDVAFGNLLKQLPDRSKMELLITDVNQAGISQGLQFELFKPAAQETQRDFYAELPIAIKVTGSYHQLGRFASEIGQLSRIVTLNDVAITIATGGAMQMETTARTFRYLSEQEIAQREQEARARKRTEKKR